MYLHFIRFIIFIFIGFKRTSYNVTKKFLGVYCASTKTYPYIFVLPTSIVVEWKNTRKPYYLQLVVVVRGKRVVCSNRKTKAADGRNSKIQL